MTDKEIAALKKDALKPDYGSKCYKPPVVLALIAKIEQLQFTISRSGDNVSPAMSTKKPKDEMLTARQIAERMDVPLSTVRWWLRRKLFPNQEFIKNPANSYWQVPASDLVGFERPRPGPKPKKSTAKAGKKK
jgi:hypothetical protein